MAKRGRKPKIRLSFKEEKLKAILKYQMGFPLTLEETSYMMAKSEEDRLSVVAIRQIEQSALAKIKEAFKTKYGIESISDIFEFN